MATNIRHRPGYELAVDLTNPTSGVSSGDPVRFGERTGIALTDQGETSSGLDSTDTSVYFGPCVAEVSVKGVDDSGNSAVAVGDSIYYVDADTPKLSKKASGYFFGFAMATVSSGATSTIEVAKVDGGAYSGTVNSGDIATGAVTAAKLSTTLKTGFIPLDITSMREISSNAIQNLAAHGGILAADSTPILQRVNGATDKAIRVLWEAGNSAEAQFAPVPKPPDLDASSDLTIHLLCAMEAANDTPAIDAQVFDGIGDTEMGGSVGAITGTSITEYSVTIANANIAAAPGFLNISLVPGAHTTDDLYMYAAWIEYTRA